MSLPTGVSVPSEKFINSLAEEFPNGNRMYKVESGIISRHRRDYLPINCSLSNGSVNDSYLEFVLNSSENEFIDCNAFALEMKIKLQKNAADITPSDNVILIDGAGHRLLSMHSVFINGVPTESNSYYGLCQAVDTYTSMHKSSLSSVGRNMYYQDLEMTIPDTVTAATFGDTALTKTAKEIKSDCTGIIHMMIPIRLNIASSDFYLLSGCSMRIRFDLCNAKLLINAPGTADEFSYSIENVKLWTQKIVPDTAALLSLNRSLFNGKSISYVHERPVVKNFVFSAGHISLNLDNIFNNIVPHMVHMVILKQSAVNGQFNLNGAHFAHCNLTSLRLEINGNTHSAMTFSFPGNVANVFHHTITSLKNDDNLLSLQSFKHGRTIYSWDLRASECSDVLPIEKSANLRINLQASQPLQENYVVFVIGITTGLIEIYGNRVVKTSFLM